MQGGNKSRNYLFVLLLLITFILAGCGRKNVVVNYETQQIASQQLTFFGYKHEAVNVEVIEDIMTAFMSDNPDVLVSYESIKGNSYFDALKNRLSSGHLDDVFMVNHDVVLDFAENNSLADLSDLLPDINFSENIRGQLASADGKIYWLPTTVSAFGLYCNLDLLAQHGQKVPTNLGEWQAVCDYFVAQGITPIVANNDISLKTLVLAHGFYPLYQEGRQAEAFARLNSGEAKLSDYLADGLLLVKNFCDWGYVDAAKALNTEKTSDDLAEFVQGEAPFMLTGAWAAGRVKGMEPDFAFKVVPYPILADGSVLIITPDVRLSVSAQCYNPDLAKQFVAFFMQKENLLPLANNQASFSPLNDEYMPSLTEIHDIVRCYRTQVSVMAADSQIEFPVWNILQNTVQELLAGEDLAQLTQNMDSAALAFCQNNT